MIKTVTLTANTEQAVKIEGGTYCSIENRGEGVVYASKYPDVSALADNVVAIDPGNNKILENATKKSNNGTMQGTIYLITDQEGTIEIRTATTVNPFKIKRKGGDKNTSKSEFNIHYGDTAPEDTSKLWVKTCDVPSKVSISPTVTTQGSLPSMTTGMTVFYSIINACAYGDYIYLFGGYYYSTSESTLYGSKYIYRYSARTGTTYSSGNFGPCFYETSPCRVGNYIYLFANMTSTSSTWSPSQLSTDNKIYRFYPLTDTYTTLSTTLPSAPPSGCAAVAVGTDIYIFKSKTVVYKFDTTTEAVTTLSVDLPIYANKYSTTTVGTDIYIYGNNTLCKFDTITQNITTLSLDLPTAVGTYYQMAAVGTDIYIFSGVLAKTLYIYKFDTISQKLLKLTKTGTCRSGTAAVATNGNIYLLGGKINQSGGSSSYTKYVNKFTDTPPESNSLLIKSNSDTNVFELISGDINLHTGITQAYIGDESDNTAYAYLDSYLYQDGTWTLIE